MSRDKQIEEIRKDLCEADEAFCKFCRGRRCQACEYYFARTDCKNQILAEKLTEKGYRKASEVAEEIFEEIEEIFNKRIAFYMEMAKQSKFTEKHYAETMIKNCEIYLQEIAELKRKYIGKDTNVGSKDTED